MNYIKKLLSYITDYKDPNELTVQYWDIYLSEGFYSACHGEFTEITELYVPDLDLSINMATGPPLNIFMGGKDRYIASNHNMSRHSPKLIKTIKINGTVASNLRWLADVEKFKKEKEKSVYKLFQE